MSLHRAQLARSKGTLPDLATEGMDLSSSTVQEVLWR